MAGIYTSKYTGEEIDNLLDKAKESGSAADVSQLRDVIKSLQHQLQLWDCTTASADIIKVIQMQATPSGFAYGVSFKVKMAEANTATKVVFKLQNFNLIALKVYYNGELASDTNTWKAGEVLECYIVHGEGTTHEAYCKPW